MEKETGSQFEAHGSQHSKESSLLDALFEGQDPKEKMGEWMEEAKSFISQNPALSVLGALAVGYMIGKMTTRRKG